MRKLLGTGTLKRERKSSQMKRPKIENRASLKVSLINFGSSPLIQHKLGDKVIEYSNHKISG
jgi:hypothetical protein